MFLSCCCCLQLSRNVGRARAAVVLFNYILSKVMVAQLPAAAFAQSPTFNKTSSSFDEQLSSELQQLRAALEEKKKLAAAGKFISASAQIDRIVEQLKLQTSSHEVAFGEDKEDLGVLGTSADQGVQEDSVEGSESVALLIEQLSTEKEKKSSKKSFNYQLGHEFAQVGEGYSGNILLK